MDITFKLLSVALSLASLVIIIFMIRENRKQRAIIAEAERKTVNDVYLTPSRHEHVTFPATPRMPTQSPPMMRPPEPPMSLQTQQAQRSNTMDLLGAGLLGAAAAELLHDHNELAELRKRNARRDSEEQPTNSSWTPSTPVSTDDEPSRRETSSYSYSDDSSSSSSYSDSSSSDSSSSSYD